MVSPEAPTPVPGHADNPALPLLPDPQQHATLPLDPTDLANDQPPVIELELQDLDDLEFLLDEIENQIAPLA